MVMLARASVRIRRLSAVLAAGCLIVLTAAWPSTANPNRTSEITVVAEGLDNPRGLAFDRRGALYVAEAGRGGDGPCIITSAGVPECLGATGAITRIADGEQERLVSGLPSIASPALGGGNAIGPSDITFDGRAAYVTIGLAADPGLRPDLGPEGAGMGRLYRMRPGGGLQSLADIARFEADENPDGDVVDTNPHGVLSTKGGRFIADAGGNAVLRVDPDRDVSTVAVLPTGVAEDPGGNEVAFHAVPTSVAEGPDGALYVGQLTGFPFPVGGASIFRIDPREGEPEVYLTGFTHIIDLAFAEDGSLYVLQIATDSLFIAPPSPGALIRIAPDGTRDVIAQDELSFPTGLAIGPEGDLYVSNNGGSPGIGEVLRIPAP
jgi:hypothetical protein